MHIFERLRLQYRHRHLKSVLHLVRVQVLLLFHSKSTGTGSLFRCCLSKVGHSALA